MKKILLCVFMLLVSVNVFAGDVDIKQSGLKQLTERANNGDAEAQYLLGLGYYLIDGSQKNYEQTYYWWQKAAKQGHAKAQSDLGILYIADEAPENNQQAIYWLQEASEQGYIEAYGILGTFYFLGNIDGIPQDFKLAYMWFYLGLAKAADLEKQETFTVLTEKTKLHMTPAEIAEAEQMAAEWMERHR